MHVCKFCADWFSVKANVETEEGEAFPFQNNENN
jgi:hypothetical protein